ncbi:hypothetical protein ACOMHN_034208 [Nucella lapillus]
MATDIDSFIREQKTKLATERQSLAGSRARTPEIGLPLSNREAVHRREHLALQRKQEYNQFLNQRRQSVDVGDGKGKGQQHGYQQTSKQLAQQRRQDYNDMLVAKEREPKVTVRENEITNPGIIPYNRAQEEQEKKRLREAERHRDYQQMKAKLDEKHNSARNQDQHDEKHLGLDVGQYERNRRKEVEQQQYRDVLAQQVEEKRRLQLRQIGAPQPEVAAHHPSRDRDFRSPSRKRGAPLKIATSNPQPAITGNSGHLRARDGGTNRTMDPVDFETHRRKVALKDAVEYRVLWEQIHRKKSPRTLTVPLGASLDVKRNPEPPETGGGGPRTFDRRIERKLSELEYQNLWKHMHGGPQAQNAERHGQKSQQRVVQNPQASTNVYEEQKKALQAQRKQEMQSFLQQQKVQHEDQSQRRQWREREEEGRAVPNSEDHVEAARKKLAEDRNKDYLEMKEKSESKRQRRKWDVPETAMAEKPMQLGGYERQHQQFRQERQQDYIKMLQSQKQGNRSWRELTEEKPLPVGHSEGRKKQLEVERNREYNEYLKSKDAGNRTWREPSAEKLLPLGDYEQKRKAIEDARKTEYQEFLRKTADRNHRRLWKEASHEELLLSDEPHARKREELKSERQADYRQYLREEEDDKLKKALGDIQIPGIWQKLGEDPHQQNQPPHPSGFLSDRRDQRLPTNLQWPDTDRSRPAAQGQQREGHGQQRGQGQQRDYQRLQQPATQNEPSKKVRIALDQPLLPEFQTNRAEDYKPQSVRSSDFKPRSTLKPVPEGKPLPARPASDSDPPAVGASDAYHKKLQEERRRDYNQMLERKRQEEAVRKAARRNIITPSTDDGFLSHLGSRDSERSRLRDERHREYNEMLTRKMVEDLRKERFTPAARNSNDAAFNSTDQSLAAQNNNNNNNNDAAFHYTDPGPAAQNGNAAFSPIDVGPRQQQGRSLTDRAYQERYRTPRGERVEERRVASVNEGLVSRLGSRDSERDRLREERHREYQEFLKQTTDRRSLAQQTDEYKAKASFPGMNESDNAKIQKERERNEEYNQFLKEKHQGRRQDDPAEYEPPKFVSSLPGLRDSNSAKQRKEQQRNAEYNLYLQSKKMPAKSGNPGRPPLAPRNVWATPVPSYDDMLDRKRLQESQYRRTNDPNYDIPPESERKLAELDKELEKKKACIRSERLSQGVLDDPTWLSPRKEPSDIQYEDLAKRERRGSHENPDSYYASLPLGEDFTGYEKKRQQDQYRQELEKQMQETADGKQSRFQKHYADGSKGVGSREKSMDLKVDYSGYIDPEVRKPPAVVMASTRRQRQAPARVYQSNLLDSLDKLDQISPRSEVILGRRRLDEFSRLGGPLSVTRGTARGGGVGVTDPGIESMVNPPRLSGLAPPPGLEYQPASYITQGGGGGLGQTSVDEAYTFYATHNPLEEAAGGGGDGGGGGGGGGGGVGGDLGRFGGRRARSDQEVAFTGGGGYGGPTRARMEEEKRYGVGRPMDFAGEEDGKRSSQMKAQNYQEDLRGQIEQNRRKKMRDREEKDRYDQKIEQEAKDYNPYGRGGGGAPMRDSYGNLVTDLRSMRRDNENLDSPRRPPPPNNPYLSPRGNIRDDLIGPPPVQTTAEGEQSYARGGHGIFGMPKTDADKVQSEKYKNDLMRQIEEKKFEEMRKKEKEREDEQREQRRVDDQQRRMQEEYEDERRRTRDKEEEARRRNDELVRLAEERRLETELRRRQEDDRRDERIRQDREADDATRVTEKRPESPPVPAARTRSEPRPPPTVVYEDRGPPVRTHSADVLNQLAAMRKQLQNERQRVETMLEKERNDPEVFDPRLVQRPTPALIVRPEIDVFETARHRNAVPVRRTPADRPNTQAVEDFGTLKFKDDSDSRKEFRRVFPEQPSTGETLEAQQAAMLRQQEDNLRHLRDQRRYGSDYPKTSLGPSSSRNQSLTPQQLHSNSAFVDVDNMNHFPDDFDDIPTARRNESPRTRRRDRRDFSPMVGSRGGYTDPFGSTASLNVDRLAKKNEDRLKRLREMQGKAQECAKCRVRLKRLREIQGKAQETARNAG